MVRTRPTLILVMAILSIVFGSIWTLVWFCTGILAVAVYYIQLPQPGGTGNPARELSDLLMKEVPAYLPVEVTHYVLGFVLGVLLILSGIGLLRMRVWARWTAIAVSAVMIVWHCVHFVFQWIYVNPVVARWTEELMRKQPQGTPNFAAFSTNPAFQVVVGVGTLLFTIGYPIVLLVIMLLPRVGAAFANQSRNPVPPMDAGDASGPPGLEPGR